MRQWLTSALWVVASAYLEPLHTHTHTHVNVVLLPRSRNYFLFVCCFFLLLPVAEGPSASSSCLFACLFVCLYKTAAACTCSRTTFCLGQQLFVDYKWWSCIPPLNLITSLLCVPLHATAHTGSLEGRDDSGTRGSKEGRRERGEWEGVPL